MAGVPSLPPLPRDGKQSDDASRQSLSPTLGRMDAAWHLEILHRITLGQEGRTQVPIGFDQRRRLSTERSTGFTITDVEDELDRQRRQIAELLSEPLVRRPIRRLGAAPEGTALREHVAEDRRVIHRDVRGAKSTGTRPRDERSAWIPRHLVLRPHPRNQLFSDEGRELVRVREIL